MTPRGAGNGREPQRLGVCLQSPALSHLAARVAPARRPRPAAGRHGIPEKKRAVEVEEPMTRALAEIFVVNIVFGPAGVVL